MTVNRPLTRKRPKREVETVDYLAACRRFIRAAGRRAAEADDIELADLVALHRDLDEAIHTAVNGIHDRGNSWAYIGTALGVTRQAAQERWGRKPTP